VTSVVINQSSPLSWCSL